MEPHLILTPVPDTEVHKLNVYAEHAMEREGSYRSTAGGVQAGAKERDYILLATMNEGTQELTLWFTQKWDGVIGQWFTQFVFAVANTDRHTWDPLLDGFSNVMEDWIRWTSDHPQARAGVELVLA